MRPYAQRLYWSLVDNSEHLQDLPFSRLADFAGIPQRPTRSREILECLEELKSSGLATYALDLAGVSEISIDATPDARRTMRSVFVVHGHDEKLLAEVDALLLRVGLHPIVLKTMPSAGRTVIEKIEKYSNVQFAVCLLTPDDEGRAIVANSDLQPRARQNVVLELGYFLGRLGRDRVHALHRGGLELPSDYHGVVYTATDVPNSDWRIELCKEMRNAGLPVDIGAIM